MIGKRWSVVGTEYRSSIAEYRLPATDHRRRLHSSPRGVINEGMKCLLSLCLVVTALGVSAEVRPPAVAGSFYPGDADALRSQVEALLKDARDGSDGPPARAEPSAIG